jgi:hypothetical protein
MIEPCKRPIMFELTHTADLSHWTGSKDDRPWLDYLADVRAFVQRIGYTAVDGPLARDGWLVYVKPMLRGDEPPDVRNYASGSPSFPHETTANQWFNESQTESYRALGAQSIDDLVHGLGLGPDDLARRAEAAWKQ